MAADSHHAFGVAGEVSPAAELLELAFGAVRLREEVAPLVRSARRLAVPARAADLDLLAVALLLASAALSSVPLSHVFVSLLCWLIVVPT